MAAVKEKSIRIEFLQAGSEQKPVKGEIAVFNGFFTGLSGWNWGNGDKKTGKNGWCINSDGSKKGIILSRPDAFARSNEETVTNIRNI